MFASSYLKKTGVLASKLAQLGPLISWCKDNIYTQYTCKSDATTDTRDLRRDTSCYTFDTGLNQPFFTNLHVLSGLNNQKDFGSISFSVF